MIFAVFLLVYVAASTAGLLLLRTALPESASVASAIADPRVIGGGALYAISFVAWMLALRRYELTIAYPVFVGTGYATVIGMSMLVLGERLSVLQGIGVTLVAIGVLFIVG